MKKILLVEAYYNGFYGAQKSMVQLIKVLRKENEVVVLTTKKGRLQSELRNLNINVKIIKLAEKANVFGGRALKYSLFEKIQVFIQIIFFQLKVFKYLRQEKIDLVYSNDARSFFMIFLAAKLNKIRTLTYVRADWEDNFLSRICLKKCDKVITIADGLLKKLPQKYIERYSYKIKNIYTGFNFNEYDYESKLKNISENKVKIGYVGSITDRKGLDFFIKILIRNHKIKEKVQFIIAGNFTIGNEKYWENLKKNMIEKEIDYIFLGYQNSVCSVYNSIDLLVLPSLSEGLPRVIIEGMAHSLPVIANDVGGTNQIIEDSVNGFLEKPFDEEKWEKDLLLLIENSELRIKMGVASKRIVTEKFELKKFEEKIKSLITIN